ncbi:MAG: hypothetical protein CMG71_02740 [Candidatus Marinimicrobia bacterium]|nr:hypothetical protein [Candidatus Neomarinimicrobiota bacterium]
MFFSICNHPPTGAGTPPHTPTKHRRVVPSPKPISIIEAEAIRELVDAGKIVITVGGGGIPVYRHENGDIEGGLTLW